MHVSFLLSVTAAAFLGSPHCAAMCGGLVSFCGAGAASSRNGLWRVHLAYNLSRGAVYVGLGAVSGTVGNAIDALGVHAGLRHVPMLIAGAVMIAFVLHEWLRFKGVQLGRRFRLTSWLGATLAGWVARLKGRAPVIRALIVGSATALLPCGWLYLWVVAAGATASPWAGAAVMAAFWLGTLPMMLGIGWVARRLGLKLRQRIPAFTALTLLAFGLWSLLGRWNVPDTISNLARVENTPLQERAAAAARGQDAP